MAETAGAAGSIKALQADVNANTLAPVTSRYVNPHYTDTSKSGAACTSVNNDTVRYTTVSKKGKKPLYHKKTRNRMRCNTAMKET